MRQRTTIIIVVVALVIVVLASPLFISNNGSNNSGSVVNKTASMAVEFSDASTSHFRGMNTTWSKGSTGNWTHVSTINSEGKTVFRFENVSFSSNALDLLTACSKIGNFSITKQLYVGMGTIVLSIDSVANENPGRGWQFYVNNNYATTACDKVSLSSANDTVVWKFMVLQG
jgi:hypothetical protein